MALTVLVVLAGCQSGGSGVAASQSPSVKPSFVESTVRTVKSPSDLVEGATSAMLAKGSAHIDCDVYASTDSTLSVDVGIGTGRNVTTFSDGDTMTFLLVDGIGYARASGNALVNYYGFPEAMAERLAGKWISMGAGDSYAQLSAYRTTDGLQIDSESQALDLADPLKLEAPRMLDGQTVVGVSGGVVSYSGEPSTKDSMQTVYLPLNGDPLPVATSTHEAGFVWTCTYSKWGESVDLTAPKGSVPISSLKS